ncbi:trace amine-associated receptor 1-like [Xyrichtys novacula]|uniref:Trace amine-associated receptor 1-like n=1 Tax=Xyrichtys novacula TaxID=13765 RepID=A0AAV1GXP2_XYRNO|nr:trace amine-associated receptor 1-like [Xyrichtys novacula]
MGPNISENRSAFVINIHPCYEIHDFDYILSNTPSVVCFVLYIFIFLLSVVTVFGNLLVIIAIIYFTQLHSPTNFLILSLSVADMLVGIVVFPLSMAFSLSSCMHHEDLFCKIRSSFDVSLSTCSILNLCCISIDRYYAVCQPLSYKAKISHRVAVLMILMSWGGSALIGIGILIAGLNEKCDDLCFIDKLMENTIGPILSFYFPVIIMLCIYLKIFLVAQRQARKIMNIACQSTKSGATVTPMALNPLEGLLSVATNHQLVSSSTAHLQRQQHCAAKVPADLDGHKRGACSSFKQKKWVHTVCGSRPKCGAGCNHLMRSGTLRGQHSPENAARERSRIRNLRQAFHSLQAALPSVPPDTKLSKLDVLVLATNYIAHLTETLDQGGALADQTLSARTGGYLHPVKKWPMRSLLYCGSVGNLLTNIPTNQTPPPGQKETYPQTSAIEETKE